MKCRSRELNRRFVWQNNGLHSGKDLLCKAPLTPDPVFAQKVGNGHAARSEMGNRQSPGAQPALPEPVAEILVAFQCGICRATDPSWTSSKHSERVFSSPRRHVCGGSVAAFPARNVYLELQPGDPALITPIQQLLQ